MARNSRGGPDPALDALKDLARALEENAADQRVLADRISSLVKVREGGSTWLAALEQEEEPATVQQVSTILARLSGASGNLRRNLVVALRQEGATIPVIAQLFGVTHQRVSNLLRRTPD